MPTACGSYDATHGSTEESVSDSQSQRIAGTGQFIDQAQRLREESSITSAEVDHGVYED